MECKEQKLKGPRSIHATRVKQILERAAESDKHGSNDKCMKARKVMDSDVSEACTYCWGLCPKIQFIDMS